MKTYHKQRDNVYTIEQVLEMLGLSNYDSLEDHNTDYIQEIATVSYAHKMGYDVRDHGDVFKECERCDGTGYVETIINADEVECNVCDGSGEIELEYDEIYESDEFQAAEMEHRESLYKRWLNTLEETLEYALSPFNLEAHEVRLRVPYEANGKRKFYYTIAYEISLEHGKTWKQAAAEFADTISGVGYFWFDDAKELMDVGPHKSYRETVLYNIGYITDRPSVYGGHSIDRWFTDNLEQNLRSW